MGPRPETLLGIAEKWHLSLAVVCLVDVLKSPLIVGSGVEAELGHHCATVGSVVVDVGGGQALTSDTGHVTLLNVVSLHRQMCYTSVIYTSDPQLIEWDTHTSDR